MRPEDREHFAPIAVMLKDRRSIIVRFLEPTDGDALAEFYESVPRGDYRFYSPHPLTRDEAMKKAQRADGSHFVCAVGVEESEKIAGYAWYDWKDAESAPSVFGICLRRDYQGSGAGQALMRRLFEAAREIGPARITLTVQKSNLRAVALYQKMGFTILREQLRPAFEEFPEEPEYALERAAR